MCCIGIEVVKPPKTREGIVTADGTADADTAVGGDVLGSATEFEDAAIRTAPTIKGNAMIADY